MPTLTPTPVPTPTADLSVPPLPPAGLRARVLSPTAIELTWQPVRGATGYRVLWDAGAGSDERAQRAVVAVPRYVDDLLLPGTYRYWVVAVGPGGNSAPATIQVHLPID